MIERSRVIPCLDVLNNDVVKGERFVSLVHKGDPAQMAQQYSRGGADEVIVLNIHASRGRRETKNFLSLVNKMALATNVPINVGGGIRTLTDVRDLLSAGADKVSINSHAMINIDLVAAVAQTYGSQCVTVAVDAAKNSRRRFWEVSTHGGSLQSNKEIVLWIKQLQYYGAGEILLTSIDKDGTKSGFDLALVKLVSENTTLPIIASGGAGSASDCAEVIGLGRCSAVLTASILHSGQYLISKLKRALGFYGINTKN